MIETDREGKTPGSVLCGLVYAPGCALLVTFHVYDAKKILVDALGMTRVNSTNVLDEGLEIREIGRRMNLKEKISQTRRVSRINVVVNLTYSQYVHSGSIHITISVYDMNSYFNYDYTWA
jgi:hypothetical protein